ncbi:MAG TPA: hypothetical protein VIF82_08545 [Burkholderiaceae bacterium]|jgi:hypothetical protein
MKYITGIHIRIHFFLLVVSSMYFAQAIAAEQPIGRLFSTPKERAELDKARQSNSKNRIESSTPITNQIGDQIMLDGFVKKNNGKTTVWVNQVPQHGHENPQGITIVQSDRNPSTVSIQLPSGKSVYLKAGQTFNASSGKIIDVYDDANAAATKAPAK